VPLASNTLKPALAAPARSCSARLMQPQAATVSLYAATMMTEIPEAVAQLVGIDPKAAAPAVAKGHVALTVGAAVEYWHAGGICFGTYLGTVPGKKSLRVSSAAAVEHIIDGGQVISVWSSEEMRGLLPDVPEHWQSVQEQATQLLTELLPRALDLQDLWQTARVQKKGVLVGTADVAKWLFGMKGRWGKWRVQAFVLDSDKVNAAGFTNEYSYKPLPGERVAAGKVLALELHRFKRVQCQMVQFEPNIVLSKGGFKPITASVVVSNEILSFTELAKQGATAVTAISDPAHRQIIHGIEMLALGGSDAVIDYVIPEAERALKQLGYTPSAQTARKLLLDMGVWTSQKELQQLELESKLQQQTATDDSSSTSSSSAAAKPITKSRVSFLPWSAEALAAAQKLTELRERKTAVLTEGALADVKAVGTPLPNGRRDYRAAAFKVFCIDNGKANFLDDAVSWDADNDELLIHVADVQGSVSEGSVLDNVGKMRVGTQYLPHAPLFMMPPVALEALSLSAKVPNEAVTVALKLNATTGAVESSRIMLTVLPPVVPLSYDAANALFASGDTELTAIIELTRLSAAAAGRTCATVPSKTVPLLQRDKSGNARSYTYKETPTHLLISEVLALYSSVAVDACRRAGAALPMLVGHGERVLTGRTRFATAPLRRFVDLLAQRQVCAVLGKRPLLSKKQVGDAVHQLTRRRNKVLAADRVEDEKLKYEALATHCNKSKSATGLPHAVLQATATGRGNEVSINGLGVLVQIKGKKIQGWAAGDAVSIQISNVDVRSQQVAAQYY
jgi:exoribonuclease R